MSFVCVLASVVSGGGTDILLTTHSGRPALVYLSSVLVQRLLLPYKRLTHCYFGGVSSRSVEGKYIKKEEEEESSYVIIEGRSIK